MTRPYLESSSSAISCSLYCRFSAALRSAVLPGPVAADAPAALGQLYEHAAA